MGGVNHPRSHPNRKTMFLCLQINEYFHGRAGRKRRGHCAMLYRVQLDPTGRPIWVIHNAKVWWAVGYANNKEKVKKAATKRYPDVPWIASAAHRKRVSMTEASKLVDVVPPACLDRLAELVADQPWSPPVTQSECEEVENDPR